MIDKEIEKRTKLQKSHDRYMRQQAKLLINDDDVQNCIRTKEDDGNTGIRSHQISLGLTMRAIQNTANNKHDISVLSDRNTLIEGIEKMKITPIWRDVDENLTTDREKWESCDECGAYKCETVCACNFTNDLLDDIIKFIKEKK